VGFELSREFIKFPSQLREWRCQDQGRSVAQETYLVMTTSGVMGLRFVGKSTRILCGTPEIATPTAPSEYTLSLKNMVKGRPVMNGVDEHVIPI